MPLLKPCALAAVLALGACAAFPDLVSPSGTAGGSGGQAGAGATGGSSALSVADQSFMTQAAYGGLSEVALGEIAQQRAGDPAVRDFGRRMVMDHSRANQQLVALARAKGVELPTAPDPGRQEVADVLEDLSGAAFDRQYMQQQLAEHEMAITLYRTQANNGVDPDIRAFAAQTLPVLETHAQMIRSFRPAMAGLTR